MKTHKRAWGVISAILLVSMLVTPGYAGSAAQASEPITFSVRTPAYQLDTAGLRVPGYNTHRTPGAPALPVYQTIIELPESGDFQLTVTTPGAQDLAVQIAIPAAPSPDASADHPRTSSDPDALPPDPVMIVRPDPAIYEVDAFYPSRPVIAGEVQVQRGRRLLPIQVFPFQYNPVTGALRYLPEIGVTVTITPADNQATDAAAPDLTQVNPPAVNGNALRVYISQRGMHRLTYTDLATAGVPLASTSVSTFAMYYLGQPVDIQTLDRNGNNRFDADDLVIFYAEPYQGRYMTRNVYWFSYGSGSGARMQTRARTPTGAEPVVTSITQSARVEVDKVYVSDIQRSKDEDHYFDTSLYANVAQPTVSRAYDLPVNDPVATGPASLRAGVYGGVEQGAGLDQSMAIRVNGNAAGVYQWTGKTGYIASTSVSGSWLTTGVTQVTLEAALSQLPGLPYYWIYPDWVELTYTAAADAEADRIYIESAPAGANEVVVTGFSTPGVRVYDVRNPRQPVQLTTVQSQPSGGGHAIHFWDADLPNPSYYLATETALLAPVEIQADTPSSWQSPSRNASYIAIVHGDLWNAIQPLLDHRQAEGLTVAKVNIQDIYDEFSYGRVDPEAIRAFLTYAYQNWRSDGSPPDYVMLVGDGHHDFKNVENSTLKNLIPPYLVDVDPWIGETAADNRFVSVDGPADILPEMHIGRVSAQNAASVASYVNKVLAYENAAGGAWQNKVAFIADDCNNSVGDFNAISELIRKNWLPAQYTSSKAYYRVPTTGDNCPDANYTDPTAMKNAIKAAYNGQNLLLQWFGHGSRFRWGYSDSLFNYEDVATLAPNTVWPVVMHYTCYTGYFHNVYQNLQSLAETELTATSRGSVAGYAATGQHLGTDELVMNEGVNKALFYDRLPRIGQVIDSARNYYFVNSPSYLDLIDSSVLFGDPALKVKLPALATNANSYLPMITR